MRAVDHLFEEEHAVLTRQQEKELLSTFDEEKPGTKKKSKNLSQEQIAVRAAANRNCRNRAERREFERKYWKEKRKHENNKNTDRSNS